MEQLLTTLINILVLSSVYISVSLGFSFLFKMLGILNLAHGTTGNNRNLIQKHHVILLLSKRLSHMLWHSPRKSAPN